MVWRYSKRADKILIHNVNNMLMVELNEYYTLGFRFSLPNASPRMCRSSNSVETENFNPLKLMIAGSNDDKVEPGLVWGHWSVRKHGMLLLIDGVRKFVLTNDGFVLSDSLGGLVVEDGVETVLSSLEADKYIAQAESTARVAFARNNSPKVGFNPAPCCQLKSSIEDDVASQSSLLPALAPSNTHLEIRAPKPTSDERAGPGVGGRRLWRLWWAGLSCRAPCGQRRWRSCGASSSQWSSSLRV
jgi:hypothetical protein